MDRTELTILERALLTSVFVLSLLLRLTGLGVFETTDEAHWHTRSIAFRNALQKHDWASTFQCGHPGVLTMWLGAAAEQFKLLQRPLPGDGTSPFVTPGEPDFGAGVPTLTMGARRLVGLVTWLGVLGLYLLLRQLFAKRIALVATILMALDPFFLAHSRLHHVDALLATFTSLSIIGLSVYVFRGRRWGYLVASAVAAGLAISSKSPGVALVPIAGLALLVPVVQAEPAKRNRECRHAAAALALWGVIAAATLTAIWPAMWVSPLATLQKVFGTATYYAETPHEGLNFFWFAVRLDPGPAFYPVAWAFRATPWALLGLAALFVGWRQVRQRWEVLLLAATAIAFAVAMTLGAKKFDRYLLPVFPLVDIIAAVGWMALFSRFLPRLAAHRLQLALTLVFAFLASTQVAWLWPTRPYYLSYYNPLLGGGKTAPSILLTGWGEGLDRVADYMNRKAGAEQLVACSWPRHEFGYFFCGQTLKESKIQSLAELDYLVFYRSALQRGDPALSSRFMGVKEPELVLNLNGIDYAWLFENTLYDRAEREILAEIEAAGDPQRDLILVNLKATMARTYRGAIPLEVFAPVDRLDVLQMGLERITAGRRHVWHLIYPDAEDGLTGKVAELIEQQASISREIEVDGVRAVRYDLPAEPHFVPAPLVASGARFGEQLTLSGYDASSTDITPGKPLSLRFHWQTGGPVTRSYVFFCHVIGPGETKYGQWDGVAQGWRLPTTAWQPGAHVLDDVTVEIAADAPPGEYLLVVGMYDQETHDRLPVYDAAGNPLANDVLILSGFRVVS